VFRVCFQFQPYVPVLTLCLMGLVAATSAAEQAAEYPKFGPGKTLGAEHIAPRTLNFQISSPHRSLTYSCNLIKASNQCREYEVLQSAKDTLNELREGCESMGAEFKQSNCPSRREVASCNGIIRNYHRLDVIYTNRYYRGAPSLWDRETVERVCGDLGGEIEIRLY